MLVLKYSFITFVDSVNDDCILYTNIQKKNDSQSLVLLCQIYCLLPFLLIFVDNSGKPERQCRLLLNQHFKSHSVCFSLIFPLFDILEVC